MRVLYKSKSNTSRWGSAALNVLTGGGGRHPLVHPNVVSGVG